MAYWSGWARSIALGGAALALAAGALAAPPVAGPNVNMVSGTKWPEGDPFLTKQNEPSLAISSRNARHLLAGANDYRLVPVEIANFRFPHGTLKSLFQQLSTPVHHAFQNLHRITGVRLILCDRLLT